MGKAWERPGKGPAVAEGTSLLAAGQTLLQIPGFPFRPLVLLGTYPPIGFATPKLELLDQ